MINDDGYHTMNKFGLYTDKPSISFESHLQGLEEQTRASFVDIRDYVKSLGENVIEEVRPHRVVYAKSLTFRTFLDIQPKKDSLIVSIKHSRKESPKVLTVNNIQQVEDIKSQIRNAYQTIS
jgi:dimeric dUTPase (all-alpha-NTP-PPase superfamily)